MSETAFEIWAILELMGHVRMAGKITEEERFGMKMGRIEIPRDDESCTTVYFGGASVFRMTPVSEEMARRVAIESQPRPARVYELQAPRATAPRGHQCVEYDDDDDDEVEF